MAPYAGRLAKAENLVKFWYINGGVSHVDTIENVTYESFKISMADFHLNEAFHKFSSALEKIHPVLNARLVTYVNESLYTCSRFLHYYKYSPET